MPQFSQSGFNTGAFGSDSVGYLPASGSSSLTVNVIRRKFRPVGLSGRSSLAITFQVNRASAMVVPGSGQFNQFAFNEEQFGAAPASLLNATGSSWLSIAIQKQLHRGLSVQGFSSSSLIVRRVRRSSEFTSGSASVYIQARRRRLLTGLIWNGFSSSSIHPVRRRPVGLGIAGSSVFSTYARRRRLQGMNVSGQSQTGLSLSRLRRCSAVTSGYAFTAIQIRKRKSSAMSVRGRSFTNIAPSRVRSRPNVSTAGNSSIKIKTLRKRSRGMLFHGTNQVSIRVIKPTLSPLITTGLRVSNAGRPNMQASLRIAHSTRPASTVNLRFTRVSAPV